MLNDRLTLLIHSCGAYSDLWDGQIHLLNHYWKARTVNTVILTDTNPNNYAYENINILCAGEKKEITDRLLFALPKIETEYVLVTLDDYYLLDTVDENRLSDILDFMDTHKADYVRLYKIPKSKDLVERDIYKIHMEEKKSSYYINLYPGIWRRSFIEKTLTPSLNAWQYEVSLTPKAVKLNANCFMTYGEEYQLLDVVRKGKVLHKANKYFKKNPVYTGNREVISWKQEFIINFRTVLKNILPRKMMQRLKKFAMRHGKTFYSPLDD